MLIRKEVGFLLLGGVGILSIIGLFGSVWLYVNFHSIMADQHMQGEMIRLQAAAKLYHRRLDTYKGVCGDIGVGTYYSCNENTEGFAVSVENENGSFYCIDSTGYFGEQILPIRTKRACQS